MFTFGIILGLADGIINNSGLESLHLVRIHIYGQLFHFNFTVVHTYLHKNKYTANNYPWLLISF